MRASVHCRHSCVRRLPSLPAALSLATVGTHLVAHSPHPSLTHPAPAHPRRLHDATREAEEEGERLVAQLGAGELTVDEFVTRYTKAQATYHQREIKLQAAQQTLPTLGGL